MLPCLIRRLWIEDDDHMTHTYSIWLVKGIQRRDDLSHPNLDDSANKSAVSWGSYIAVNDGQLAEAESQSHSMH